MGDIRNYAWAFPLISGILIIIALLTPASYGSGYGVTENFWMWGLWSGSQFGYGIIFDFVYYAPEVLIPGLLCTILLFIGSIIILSKSNGVRKKSHDFEEFKASFIGLGIFFIATAIIYIIGMEIGFGIYFRRQFGINVSFWSVYSPGFGLIAPFLSGSLSIIGYGVSKIKPKETREVIVPMKKEFMKSENEISQLSEAPGFKFCPNCGYKIIKADNRFCTNCGFEFRGVPITQFP